MKEVWENFMEPAQNWSKEIGFECGQKCINFKPRNVELKFRTAGDLEPPGI